MRLPGPHPADNRDRRTNDRLHATLVRAVQLLDLTNNWLSWRCPRDHFSPVADQRTERASDMESKPSPLYVLAFEVGTASHDSPDTLIFHDENRGNTSDLEMELTAAPMRPTQWRNVITRDAQHDALRGKRPRQLAKTEHKQLSPLQTVSALRPVTELLHALWNIRTGPIPCHCRPFELRWPDPFGVRW